MDGDGTPLERVTQKYTRTGLSRLLELLDRHRVDAVGIERPDGPIVDTLLAAGVTVYVLAPSQVKALRRRYGVGRQQRRPVRRLRPGGHGTH